MRIFHSIFFLNSITFVAKNFLGAFWHFCDAYFGGFKLGPLGERPKLSKLVIGQNKEACDCFIINQPKD
jgi:hypothetical protein